MAVRKTRSRIIIKLDADAPVAQIQAKLKALGFVAESYLDAIGVLTGSIPPKETMAARKIEGVRAVEEARQVKAT